MLPGSNESCGYRWVLPVQGYRGTIGIHAFERRAPPWRAPRLQGSTHLRNMRIPLLMIGKTCMSSRPLPEQK